LSAIPKSWSKLRVAEADADSEKAWLWLALDCCNGYPQVEKLALKVASTLLVCTSVAQTCEWCADSVMNKFDLDYHLACDAECAHISVFSFFLGPATRAGRGWRGRREPDSQVSSQFVQSVLRLIASISTVVHIHTVLNTIQQRQQHDQGALWGNVAVSCVSLNFRSQ